MLLVRAKQLLCEHLVMIPLNRTLAVFQSPGHPIMKAWAWVLKKCLVPQKCRANKLTFCQAPLLTFSNQGRAEAKNALDAQLQKTLKAAQRLKEAGCYGSTLAARQNGSWLSGDDGIDGKGWE